MSMISYTSVNESCMAYFAHIKKCFAVSIIHTVFYHGVLHSIYILVEFINRLQALVHFCCDDYVFFIQTVVCHRYAFFYLHR